jgi:mono/diheme cytochrome c family protein
MRRAGLVLCFALAGLAAARAQGAAPAVTPTEQEGQRLFGQDCGVCHLLPTITSRRYGPALSRDIVKGNEAAIADFIAHGSDRMPGFQYYYTPQQIEAIVQYLDTVPAPAAANVKPTSAQMGGGE